MAASFDATFGPGVQPASDVLTLVPADAAETQLIESGSFGERAAWMDKPQNTETGVGQADPSTGK